jgi:hypothetical protein
MARGQSLIFFQNAGAQENIELSRLFAQALIETSVNHRPDSGD